MRRRLIVTVSTVIMVMALMPFPVYASESISAGGVIAGSPIVNQELHARSSTKKTVYVITKVTRSDMKKNSVRSFSYYKSGLLKKKSVRGVGNLAGAKWSMVWKYDKSSNIVSCKPGEKYGTFCNFVANKNGLLKTEKCTIKHPGGNYIERKGVAFKSKNGRISALTITDGTKMKLSYKKGLVSKVTASRGNTDVYAYDKKGNLAKASDASGNTTTIKNTLGSNGLLKKSVHKVKTKYSSHTETFMYEYKPIKVSKRLAMKISAQQWAIVNGNLNFALGGIESFQVIDSNI